MTVIEMDGIYTGLVLVDYLILHAAQRYSVLITMNQCINNYLMESVMIPGPGPSNGLAILHYETAPDPSSLTTQVRNGSTPQMPIDVWITSQLYQNPHLSQQHAQVPKKIDRTFTIDFQLVFVPPLLKFVLNGHEYDEPKIPYLFQVRDGVNITNEPQVFEILEGQGVQVIFQNRMGIGGCEAHPWHFHGRHYYVVAGGPDEYLEGRDTLIIQKTVKEGKGRFQYRDVFIAFPNQTVINTTNGAACGWYAVWFTANNNGLWLVHCHITPHMIMGKMLVLWEHSHDNPRLIGE